MTLLRWLIVPSAGGEKDSDAKDEQAASEDDEDGGEDEGPIDTKQLAAETQRVLRGVASPSWSRNEGLYFSH